MSDANIDKKICGKSGSGDSGKGKEGDCNNTAGSSNGSINKSDLSLSAVLGPQGKDKWPNIKGKGDGSRTGTYTVDATAEVAGDTMALTKDEKVKVAEHRDVFSSYNRDSKM